MGRGRPRLYKTPEEKALANREKSKCWYNRHKHAKDSARHPPRYRADKTKSEPIGGASPDDPTPSSTEPVDVPGWLSLVAYTERQFNFLIDNATIYDYLESLYQEYIVKDWPETFSVPLISVQALHKTITQCEAAVLQLAGVGIELRDVERAATPIKLVLQCLEEMECYASLGKAEALEAHYSGQLIYQLLRR